uniref:Kazal-like domain-containing protein n=1 Tax=Glossina palpalis gambiensis TaxID=67801 RepID=A0A1B0C0M4_9MUSC
MNLLSVLVLIFVKSVIIELCVTAPCTKIYDPVCAQNRNTSERRTFGNYCMLKNAQCKQKWIEICFGECEDCIK